MPTSVLSPAPERRTQAQRRADTRRALLDATAACLVEHGYAGTSTTVICQHAGVSQGALFKHFATKSALLGAAAAHLYDQLTERFLERFEAIDPTDVDPSERVEQAIALLWDLFQSPEFAASLDLELAARTDAALRTELGSVLTRHAVRVRDLSAQLFPDRAGDPAYDRTIDLVLEVMVGMAVSRIADPDPVHYRLLLAHVTTLAQQAVAPSPRPEARMTTDLTPLVDLDRYPVDRPDSDGYAELVARSRAQLAATGASELTGFLTSHGLTTMIDDAIDLEPEAFHSGGLGTAYLGLPDESLPEDHPTSYWGNYGVGAVAYDQFPAESPIRTFYEWPALLRFLTDVLDRGPVYPYADPLGALNLATMAAGDELQWHFDQTDFVVSLALRDAEVGGDFEVVPRIRSDVDERYDEVARLLGGDHSDVVTLPMVPGTLLIFEGRNSIHRVSPIEGPTSRLVGLLGYDTKPDTMSSELLKLVRYGRSEPIAS